MSGKSPPPETSLPVALGRMVSTATRKSYPSESYWNYRLPNAVPLVP